MTSHFTPDYDIPIWPVSLWKLFRKYSRKWYITLRNKCSCFIYRTLTWGTCVLLPHPVSPTSTSVWNFSSRYRIWFLFLNTGSLSRCCSKDSDTWGLYTKAVAEFVSMSDLSSSHVLLSPINKGIKLTDILFQNCGDTVNLGLEPTAICVLFRSFFGYQFGYSFISRTDWNVHPISK